MSTGMPELGSKISLISKADIRYEGRLFTVDPQECTIALSSVRSFGTEDRETQCPIPAQNQVYDYILFRGSDIKDIRVLNNVPPQTLNDPAIMQLSVPPTLGHQQFGGHPVVGHVPGPAMGGYGGAFGGIGMGGMPSGLAPGMGVPGRGGVVGGGAGKPSELIMQGSANAAASATVTGVESVSGILSPSSGVDTMRVTTEHDMIGGASRSTTPVSLHSHKSSGVDQSVQAGGGGSNAKKDDKRGGNVQRQGHHQQQRVGSDLRRRSRERKDSRGTSGGGGDGQEQVQSRTQNRVTGGQRNQQNYHYGYQSRGGDYQQRGGDYQHRGGDYQQRGGDYQQRGGDYQQRGGDYQQRGGDYQQRGGDYQQRGGDYHQSRGNDQNQSGGGNQNARGGWAQRGPPRTRGLRPRGSQGYRPMNQNQGGPPNQLQMGVKKRSTLKFDNDYDFEQANTEFEELRSQLAKVKIDESNSTGKSEGGICTLDPASATSNTTTTITAAATDPTIVAAATTTTTTTTAALNGENEKKDDSGNETGAGETEQEEEHEVFYDKKKSFFDKISCEAVERAKGKSQRTDWRQERKLNSETFGVAAMRRGNFRGRGLGYRGMGYRGGFRPGYRPQQQPQQRRDQTATSQSHHGQASK